MNFYNFYDFRNVIHPVNSIWNLFATAQKT